MLLAFVTAPAAAASADTTSLVQMPLGRTDTRRSCACLPWADVYRNHGVTCGQGLEFYAWLGSKEALPKNDPRLQEVRYNLGDEFCSKFFERMDSNRAVRMKFNTPPGDKGKER